MLFLKRCALGYDMSPRARPVILPVTAPRNRAREYLMKQIMDGASLVPSKRQLPNLKALLTKSIFTRQEKKGGVTKCGKNCATCPYMIEGKSIRMENGDDFIFQENLTCRSQNVVYVMFCAGCDSTYIGETGQHFHKRMDSHRLHINRQEYRKLAVSHHIFHCPGTQNLAIKFRTCPFFKMPLNCTRIEREAKEAFFQKKNFCLAFIQVQ